MKILGFFFVFVVFCTSCGNNLKYFTEDLYDQYEWTDNELKRIQFYVSQDIVLYKGVSDKGTKIEKGKIKLENAREVEEVIIKKGTPGVFVRSPRKNHFAISFDDKERSFLMFGPNSKANGRFLLMAKDWDRNSGEISYNGEVYETSSSSAYAALMVDIKRAKKTKYRSKTAGGQRVRG